MTTMHTTVGVNITGLIIFIIIIYLTIVILKSLIK